MEAIVHYLEFYTRLTFVPSTNHSLNLLTKELECNLKTHVGNYQFLKALKLEYCVVRFVP